MLISDTDQLSKIKAETVIGAGQQSKSSEFVKKIVDANNNLALNNSLGAWGSPGDIDYEPNPFYKEMAGSYKPNNKENLWRHEYKVLEKGRESVQGSGSYLAHVVYSTQKKAGAEAAAGGRYNLCVYEEQGLIVKLLEAWGSNNATVSAEGVKFGMQIALGTSGNMETILPAKTIFTHPDQYDLVQFDDKWEETGKIGFFLPAYLTVEKTKEGIPLKDKEGNTIFDKAIEYFKKRRDKAAKATNPTVLQLEKMNYPLIPSDMWQTNKSTIFPVNEAEKREKALMSHKLYEKNHTCVELFWDSKAPRGVNYKVDTTRHPFYEHKHNYDRDSLEGPIVIYEFPQEIHGQVPDDMYDLVGHDPYVSDSMDEGDSLGVTYIMMNPKYISKGFKGNTIVASYISKEPGGRKAYYANLEKLLAFYGNPTRGLWFEANRGDECKNYFQNRNKQFLLALRPSRFQNSSAKPTAKLQYGFTIGGGASSTNKSVSKIMALDDFADWLIEETTLSDGTKRNIERIPCLFLIRQILQFNLDKGNYDAVSAVLGCIIGKKEQEYELLNELKEKRKNNLAFLSTNSRIFNKIKHK